MDGLHDSVERLQDLQDRLRSQVRDNQRVESQLEKRTGVKFHAEDGDEWKREVERRRRRGTRNLIGWAVSLVNRGVFGAAHVAACPVIACRVASAVALGASIVARMTCDPAV